MKVLDRYILRQFIVNFILLFVVLSLLIATLDLIVNIDEFAQVADRVQGDTLAKTLTVIAAVLDFYGPQVFVYYIYAAGVLPIAAAGFTLAAMIRNRELTAILAGGVSLYRIAAPLLVAGVGCSTLMFLDQEIAIPAFRDKLARVHKNVKTGGISPFGVEFVPDFGPDRDKDGHPDWDMLFTASQFSVKTHTLSNLTILKRDDMGRAVEKISAAQAQWDADSMGWKLTDGQTLRRASPTGNTTASDLQPQPVAFVPSTLDPTTLMLHRNARYRQLLSLRELQALTHRKGIVQTSDIERQIHGRFSLMVINVLILAMGLPFFLLRGPANLLVQSVKAAPLCIGVWAGCFILMQVGSGGSIPPALAAWMPAVIYLPVALFMMDRIET
ncbi:MAG: LptF/LptG family permease [Phycisphaerales bacterium]